MSKDHRGNPFCNILRLALLVPCLFSETGVAVDTTEALRQFSSYDSMADGPMQVRMLPGQRDFTFTMYGCPSQLDLVQQLVETMKREQLGNGFDPGPGVGLANRPLYEYFRDIRWPVVGYAQTSDHQVKEGTCRLSAEQDAVLRVLDDAGVFAATQIGEWGYYFHNLSHRESWWHAVYGDEFDRYKHMMKPPGLAGFDQLPKSRRECHDIVKDYFATRQRYMQGWNLSVTGHSHYEAYVGQWHAKVIGLEVGENIAFTQSKMAFARGAARRNAKPWSIQVSPWFAGSTTTSGPLEVDENGRARGLDAGHSLSFYERMWLHAWFAGTAMVTPEASIAIFFEPGAPPYRLTSHGRKAAEVFQFMQSKDRGIPYMPVAIVLDKYCGYNAYMGKPWGILEPTAGDLEVRDLFQEQLFPGSDHIHHRPFPDNPEASYLRPTPYGEIVDVQLSDAPTEIFASYPVLLLAGDHEMTNEFVASLLQAVQKGCRLLLGQRHANSIGAARMQELAAAGHVDLLATWTNPATERPAAISHEKLEELRQAYLPVSLDGDAVLFQCNRTDTGWVIELVNNEGVVKFPAKPAVLHHNSIAMVKLTPRVPCRQWIDWRTGETLEAVDGKVWIQIEPGSTRFVEMRR